jgi:hypothetical protein
MKSDVIYKYLNVCINYFEFISKSEFLKNLYNHTFLTRVGFNAINHVFILNLNKTTIDIAIENTEKAYIYYLEYLEQLHKTNIVCELNHMDAVLFLYNKTIPNYVNETNKNTDIGISNKNSFINFIDIFNFINVVLFWENPNINRGDVLKIVFKYIDLHLLLKNDMLKLYLELSQTNDILYEYDNYLYFLKESHKRIQQKYNKNNTYCAVWKNNYLEKLSDINNRFNNIKDLIHYLLL